MTRQLMESKWPTPSQYKVIQCYPGWLLVSGLIMWAAGLVWSMYCSCWSSAVALARQTISERIISYMSWVFMFFMPHNLLTLDEYLKFHLRSPSWHQNWIRAGRILENLSSVAKGLVLAISNCSPYNRLDVTSKANRAYPFLNWVNSMSLPASLLNRLRGRLVPNKPLTYWLRS